MKLLGKIGSWLSGGSKIAAGALLYTQGQPELGVAMVISGIGSFLGLGAKQPVKGGS